MYIARAHSGVFAAQCDITAANLLTNSNLRFLWSSSQSARRSMALSKKNIIVIGASAGGIEALRVLVGGLPKELEASVFVVLHTSPQSPGILDQILSRAGALPATNAQDKEKIQQGRIYVAPPDHHLLIETGRVRITKGPKENRFRPAVDPLFRSAAQTFGSRVVGVILTGGLDDGTAGLWAVKQLGGTAIVQDPEEAVAPSMPASAMRHVKVDYSLPLGEISPLLVRLTNTLAEEEGAHQMPEEMEIEIKIAKEDQAIGVGIKTIGKPSSYACPECHGVLLQLKEEDRIRFRCHTGHAYSTDSLLAEITERIDESLWGSIRAIEEGVMLLRHLAHQAREHNGGSAEQFQKKAEEAQRRADLVRQAVMNHEKLSEAKLEQDMTKS
jgi:two-component system, chemotaxis family, protein-glutamate methylesterase/glutaminase